MIFRPPAGSARRRLPFPKEDSVLSASISDEAFAALVKGTGLRLDAKGLAELKEGYELFGRLKSMVVHRYDFAAEPAHVFKPMEG